MLLQCEFAKNSMFIYTRTGEGLIGQKLVLSQDNKKRKKKQTLRKLKGLPDYKIQKQYFCYTKSFGT